MPWRRRSRKSLERGPYPCDDCGMLTAPDGAPDEWYTVLDDVWISAGLTSDAILCVGCLEQRLGRQLSRRDFEAVPASPRPN